MNIENYFGKYDKNNIDKVIEYMNKLNSEIKPYYNFGYPFFKGDYQLNFKKQLENKELNYEPMKEDDVFKYIAPYFENIPNWNNPGTMINVIPPVNLISLATTNIANMYNPNFAQDTYAGKLISAELEVSKYLSKLVGWDYTQTHGTFTFGGKGTNLYATKVAINKADSSVVANGMTKNYFMITSKNGHPCHYEVCNWLGIGIDNCYEIECDEFGQINIEQTENIIEENLKKGKIFLGYNLTAGSTNELFVDDIKKIYDLNQKIVKKFALSYTPHIHADAVLGWVYLFFNEYDFAKNVLNIEERNLQKIQSLNAKIRQLKYADSIGVDFHKTGFCPYISSIVLFKNKDDYFTLCESDNIPLEDLNFGNYNPYHSTLELTRSCMGPVSALCTLKSLGIYGFQKIVSNMFSSACYFRDKLKTFDRILMINEETEGLATLFIILPPKYIGISLEDISTFDTRRIEEIKEYNVKYSKYLLEKAIKNEVHFLYTASRSYTLPKTNIKIGALKVYPMSVHITSELVDKIIAEMSIVISEYDKIKQFDNNIELSDNMVYR